MTRSQKDWVRYKPDPEIERVVKQYRRSHRIYMRKLYRWVVKASHFYQHAALVVSSKGEILGYGYNHHWNYRIYGAYSKKRKMKEKRVARTIHAEMDACRKVPRKDLRGATVYVIKLMNGKIGGSAPCSECEKSLNKLGVRKVYYS